MLKNRGARPLSRHPGWPDWLQAAQHLTSCTFSDDGRTKTGAFRTPPNWMGMFLVALGAGTRASPMP